MKKSKLRYPTAEDFNRQVPEGTAVTYYPMLKDSGKPDTDFHPLDTITTGKAWLMGGHSVMVTVAGMSGGVSVEHIIPKVISDQMKKLDIAVRKMTKHYIGDSSEGKITVEVPIPLKRLKGTYGVPSKEKGEE